MFLKHVNSFCSMHLFQNNDANVSGLVMQDKISFRPGGAHPSSPAPQCNIDAITTENNCAAVVRLASEGYNVQ